MEALPLPYGVDADTLFLFHLDEGYGSSVTANVGSFGGHACSVDESTSTTTPATVIDVFGYPSEAAFGNASWCATGELIGFDYNNSGSYDGDGGSAGQLSNDSLPMKALNMGNGGLTPWTLEALIRPSITNANQEIICTDSSAGTLGRAFQFRLNNAGQLELNLIALGADIKTGIPTDAANGFVANNWYHVAAAYDGVNVVLYWTKVTSATANAHAISTNAVAVGAAFGSVTGPLGIGNRTRSPAIEYFQGLIDEVRISSAARQPGQMLFSTNASGSLTVSPTMITPSNPVYIGTQVLLNATVNGTLPINYVWQSDGGSGGGVWTNLPNAITNSYVIDTTMLPAGTYLYRLLVSNAANSVTNMPATVNLLAPSGPVLVTDTAISPSNTFVGGSVSLAASFSGNPPIFYQWYSAGSSGTTSIPGATNSTFVISRVHTNNTGRYFLVASNNPSGSNGMIASSTPAALSVSREYAPGSGMYCDLLEHPEEALISASTPTFGWRYQACRRGDYQTAYRIIVASSRSLADAGTGDAWDSGMVNSSNSLNVPYGGQPLQSNTSYYWRVQTAGCRQTNTLSPAQQFNTAGALSDPLSSGGAFYQQPGAGSVNCYPLRYVPVTPITVITNSLGHWFVDFGRDAFGYATLHLNGNYSGATITFGLGERASGNTLNSSPGASIRYRSGACALQNGDRIYTNRSTAAVGGISPPSAYGIVSPFRYLELTGVPTGVVLTTNDLTQWRLQTEYDPTAASFESSSTALNQVWNLCHYSMQALTFDGIYVDGDRERTPYEADTYIHQMSSYGAVNEFTMPRCSFEYLASHLTWPTEWPMHMIFVAWADYQQTGDPYLMTKYYGLLTNKCMLYGNALSNGLVWSYPVTGNTASGDIVDWYRFSGDGVGNVDGYVAEGTNAVINAFYYRCLTIMTNVAALTGHAADAASFAARAGRVYTNYNRVFWNNGARNYVDGVGTTHSSSAANFLPLAFGLVPTNSQAAVLSYLHSRIAALGAMPAGVYGAQYLLEGLFLAGDADTALGLMTTNNARSWVNMINIGSTITDEAWSTADKSNEDWNHAWGAAPGNLIPRYILGVQPLTPGYGQILIQPHLGSSLSFVKGTVPTIRGPVSVMVTNLAGQVRLMVTVPGNVSATILLPATNVLAVVDGAVVTGTLAVDGLSNSWLAMANIGSGQHAVWTCPGILPTMNDRYNNWASSWFGTSAGDPAIAAPGADPDGDGVSNYNEFIAGTDPLAAWDHLKIAGIDYSPAPEVIVRLDGHSGRHYVLQQAASLTSPLWTSVDETIAGSDNPTIVLRDSALSNFQQIFLRVAVDYP